MRPWMPLVAAVALTAGCGGASAPVGSTARAAGFAYTVNAFACASEICTLDITIHNIGRTPRTPGVAFARAYDTGGREYLADLTLIGLDDPLLSDLAPGATIERRLRYRVPADHTIAKLELRESPDAEAISVPLP
ncbi:DUF4352 domain-containing protein [Actinoplanes sp. CA-030573]|uniref:DUF4352 domain-containing protein n=1 Tax=Actinoplanes sp. CA-030573 TaxID=3239898 RepID=UPI003D8E9F87